MKPTSVIGAGLVSSLLLAGGAYAAELTMYSGPDFRGADLTLNSDVSNLERSGFNDRAASLVVRSGRWEVCSDANFQGYCSVLGPGDYRVLEGPLFKRISSAREIAPTAYNERVYRYGAYDPAVTPPPVVYTPPPVVYTTPAPAPVYVERERGRYSALEVYSLPGFRGNTMRFDRSATTLDKGMTDSGVASLVVREGVWELCTGVDNNGTCRVFEPGRYPRLGSFEGAPVGSLRRIG